MHKSEILYILNTHKKRDFADFATAIKKESEQFEQAIKRGDFAVFATAKKRRIFQSNFGRTSENFLNEARTKLGEMVKMG